ncbi:MAG: lysine 2,3-aminomutase [Actinomycetales bacterium]|nr:lysine 2,3-aminomutase [Actinomycetales bacterium]
MSAATSTGRPTKADEPVTGPHGGQTLETETLPGPLVRPYGDTTGDGMVQVSFTLPLPHDKRAEAAAVRLAQAMGMDPALLVHAKAVGPDFTFFILYGSVRHLVDLREIEVAEREYELLSAKEVNQAIRKHLRRKLVVVGACIGTDAHTVGIDAILNIKGFAGEKGLEYYREMSVHNLGAQVLIPDLVESAKELKADAVLISQVVTQRDAHIHNTTAMSAAFREAFPEGQVPHLIVGGPRFEEGSAAALGVDRVFGRGTTPAEVASYLVHALVHAPERAPDHAPERARDRARSAGRGRTARGRTAGSKGKK